MKKIYLSILSLSLVSAVNAQTTNGTQVIGKIQSPVIKSSVKPTQVTSDKAVLWGPNTMGTPSEWSYNDNTTSGDNWVIGTAAPAGGFSGGMGAIASTSAGDGFALFDSDALGDATSSQNSDIYFNTPIDLTGQNAVAIEFESYYRAYVGNCYVIVSTDGINWTEVEVHAGLGVNNSSANPEIITANVSGIVGGSSTAYFGFRYIGGWDYAWMVDDVSIVTLPDNDVALTRGWHADIVNDYEYSMTPLTQAREMIAGVIVENQGGLTQIVDVTCDVEDGSGSVVATSMQTVTSVPGVIDTLWFSTGFTPSANGDYTPVFSIPADMVTTNDLFTASTLTVNNNLMAHDYGTVGSFGYTPAGNQANADASHGWGNIYYPEVNQEIYGIDVNFAAGTTDDLYILASVWELDATGSVQGTLIQNNLVDHVVLASESGSSITTLVFPAPSTLEAGKGYIIDILKVDDTSADGNAALVLGGTDSAQEDDDYSTVGYGDYGTAGVTYYIGWGFAPYIRANFDASLSVGVKTLEGVAVYPNPSAGEITISNNNGDENTIEVTNLAGQVVYTTTASTETTVDLGTFGSGVYIVKVSNGNGSLVERVVIK